MFSAMKSKVFRLFGREKPDYNVFGGEKLQSLSAMFLEGTQGLSYSDLQDRLRYATKNAEKAKQKAFEESIKRSKTKEDANERLHRYCFLYGYAPYGPYSPAASPVPTVGNDVKLYDAQHYQYSSPYLQPMTPTSGPYSFAAIPPKGENAPSVAAEQPPISIDSSNGNQIVFVNGVKGTTGPVVWMKLASSGSELHATAKTN
ncbi:hypothetical protein L1987_14556 [Smallanthus sonchifolius]|uniref:Uncharacterized protein n=1 Tax=Smallanthus sonchifolius TaxID=185202 RepID=A0ACB9J5F7_9ASTR|nr:hypothetical protein L1987_14556 [Smallanthus sonchifolius]